MQVSEQQLRILTLAQAIERTDTEHALVSQADLDAATRATLEEARRTTAQRGAHQVVLEDIVLNRAAAVVARASTADVSVAALAQPSARLRWLARALPVLTLLLGLSIDRIANAHRVDLLSPPLLLLLGWNVVMYVLIAVHAWTARRHPPAQRQWPHTLRRWGRSAPKPRSGRRGLTARIAADFLSHWSAQTADLFTQRATRVLHLCAAAWAAGFALSLLLRGLIVRYQFGWESTFLTAEQVHAITTVLFWPLTAGFGLAPFTLQDIAATQDFAGQGLAGGRWVWMYVGLLTLVVVLPRLALAAWARWRERQLATQRTIDLNDAAFDALRRNLPGDLVVGLVASPAHGAAWRGIVASHTSPTDAGAIHTPQGDRLRFVDAAVHADTLHAVDAVVTCLDADAGDTANSAAPPPSAWQAAPHRALRWTDFGESWVLEPTLFDQLAATLPHHAAALARLRGAWEEHNTSRFTQSIHAIAEHLRVCAQLGAAGSDHAARYAQLAQTLDTDLRGLHPGFASTHPVGPSATRAREQHTPPHNPAAPMAQITAANTPTARAPSPLRGADGTAFALGTSAGAAAGAAAGAKVGAMIDLGTGGLTMGAGTALGAALGGATAWVLRSLQKRDATDELLRHIIEAACTHYLLIAHEARVPAHDATRLAGRWQAEVTGTVAAHEPALMSALRAAPHTPTGTPAESTPDPLEPLLHTLLWGILQRSFGARSLSAADRSATGGTAS